METRDIENGITLCVEQKGDEVGTLVFEKSNVDPWAVVALYQAYRAECEFGADKEMSIVYDKVADTLDTSTWRVMIASDTNININLVGDDNAEVEYVDFIRIPKEDKVEPTLKTQMESSALADIRLTLTASIDESPKAPAVATVAPEATTAAPVAFAIQSEQPITIASPAVVVQAAADPFAGGIAGVVIEQDTNTVSTVGIAAELRERGRNKKNRSNPDNRQQHQTHNQDRAQKQPREDDRLARPRPVATPHVTPPQQRYRPAIDGVEPTPPKNTAIAALLSKIVGKEHRVQRDLVDYVNTNANYARDTVAARLDMAYRSNFNYYDLGTFACVLSLLNYLTDTSPSPTLRSLSGPRAREARHQIPHRKLTGIQQILADATWIRVQTDPELMDFMATNTLPYNNVYQRRTEEGAMVSAEDRTNFWYMTVLEEIGNALRARDGGDVTAEPNFDFLKQREYVDSALEPTEADRRNEKLKNRQDRFTQRPGRDDYRERHSDQRERY